MSVMSPDPTQPVEFVSLKWEYWTCLASYLERSFLNEKGKEGWELIFVESGRAFFKRPLQEDSLRTTIRYRKGADRGKG